MIAQRHTVEKVRKMRGQTHFYGGGIQFDDIASLPTCSVIHLITITVTPNFKCILFKQAILSAYPIYVIVSTIKSAEMTKIKTRVYSTII